MISLPSLRDLDRVPSVRSGGEACRIWLCVAPIDMRLGFDRLAELASAVTGENPLSGHLFAFRSRGGGSAQAAVLGQGRPGTLV